MVCKQQEATVHLTQVVEGKIKKPAAPVSKLKKI